MRRLEESRDDAWMTSGNRGQELATWFGTQFTCVAPHIRNLEDFTGDRLNEVKVLWRSRDSHVGESRQQESCLRDWHACQLLLKPALSFHI